MLVAAVAVGYVVLVAFVATSDAARGDYCDGSLEADGATCCPLRADDWGRSATTAFYTSATRRAEPPSRSDSKPLLGVCPAHASCCGNGYCCPASHHRCDLAAGVCHAEPTSDATAGSATTVPLLTVKPLPTAQPTPSRTLHESQASKAGEAHAGPRKSGARNSRNSHQKKETKSAQQSPRARQAPNSVDLTTMVMPFSKGNRVDRFLAGTEDRYGPGATRQHPSVLPARPGPHPTEAFLRASGFHVS